MISAKMNANNIERSDYREMDLPARHLPEQLFLRFRLANEILSFRINLKVYFAFAMKDIRLLQRSIRDEGQHAIYDFLD
jgi:hypothetical protein